MRLPYIRSMLTRICIALLFLGYACQTTSPVRQSIWKGQQVKDRYAERFFIVQDSTGRYLLSDRKAYVFDRLLLWRERGDSIYFQDSLRQYLYTGKWKNDSSFSGTLVHPPDTFKITFLPTSEAPFNGKPQDPRPPYPYLTREVTFTSMDTAVQLTGTFTLPKGKGPFPAVLLVSGSGQQDRNAALMGHKPFLVQADYYTRHGIAVLRYDDRGKGGSTAKLEGTTTEDYALDAAGGVRWLQQHPAVDTQRIFVLGHSEGGLIAPMATRLTGDIDGLILLAPPIQSGDQLLIAQGLRLRQLMQATPQSNRMNKNLQKDLFAIVSRAGEQTWSTPQLQDSLRAYLDRVPDSVLQTLDLTANQIQAQVDQLSSAWMRFFITYNPAIALRQVQVPVLALFGGEDFQVPADLQVPLLRKVWSDAPVHDTTIRIFPKANHLFQPANTGSLYEYATIDTTIMPKVMDTIVHWVQKH